MICRQSVDGYRGVRTIVSSSFKTRISTHHLKAQGFNTTDQYLILQYVIMKSKLVAFSGSFIFICLNHIFMSTF